MILDTLPTVRAAVLKIAYDNGCINREKSETELLHDCELSLLFGICDRPMLERVESFLSSLTPEEFETVCIGEETECKKIIESKKAQETEKLLNHFFESM
jgi:hypothetical protein